MRGGATCFDGQHAGSEDHEHLVESYCVKCGLTIYWDEEREGWYENEDLAVLVLTPDEVRAVQANLGRDAWGHPDVLDSLRSKLNIPTPGEWNPESARADLRSE